MVTEKLRGEGDKWVMVEMEILLERVSEGGVGEVHGESESSSSSS